MRALTTAAVAALTFSPATAADLRFDAPATVHAYRPIGNPNYGNCKPFYGPVGYRFVGGTYTYLPGYSRCRTAYIKTRNGGRRRIKHCF